MFGSRQPIQNADADESVEAIVNHVIDDINAEHDGAPFVLIRIVQAKRQLVAGLLYEVTFSVGEADCTSDMDAALVRREQCKPLPNGHKRTYRASVLHAPWKDTPMNIISKTVVNN
uniref:Cystatin domain-containing protein n=1 Tax=Trichuris muris TaxID=70415 RepID=A0A5S6QWD4_TRIMR